jgi:cytochrome c-type biogenesis protein CcmH/NrfF
MHRHRLDAVSLVFGLLFAGVGLLLLGGGPALVDRLQMAWVGPLVAIGLGVLILVAARRERAREDAGDESADPQL